MARARAAYSITTAIAIWGCAGRIAPFFFCASSSLYYYYIFFLFLFIFFFISFFLSFCSDGLDCCNSKGRSEADKDCAVGIYNQHDHAALAELLLLLFFFFFLFSWLVFLVVHADPVLDKMAKRKNRKGSVRHVRVSQCVLYCSLR